MKSPLSDQYINWAVKREYERFREGCDKRRWPRMNESALMEMGRSPFASLYFRKSKSYEIRVQRNRNTNLLLDALILMGLISLAQACTHGRFLSEMIAYFFGGNPS